MGQIRIAPEDTVFNREYVEEIINEVYHKAKIPRPAHIEIQVDQTGKKRSRVHQFGDTLQVVARNEHELKVSLGRHVIRHEWSALDWLMVTRYWTFIATSFMFLVGISLTTVVLGEIISEYRNLIITLMFIFEAVIGILLSRKSTTGYYNSIRKLAHRMSKIDCVSEFDVYLYPIRPLILFIGSAVLLFVPILFGIMIAGSVDIPYTIFIFILDLLLMVVVLYFRCKPYMLVMDQPCKKGYSGAEDLEKELAIIIDKMNFWPMLSKFYGEVNNIRVTFKKIREVQFRSYRMWESASTLRIQLCDIDKSAAFRLGVAQFCRVASSFYQKLSFDQRSMKIFIIIYGSMSVIPVMIAGIEYGPLSLTITVIIVLAGLLGLWWKNHQYNEMARREIPEFMRETGVFTEEEIRFYTKFLFPSTLRSELKMLAIFIMLLAFAGFLAVQTYYFNS